MKVHQTIIEKLNGLEYKKIHHLPTPTSADSAKERNEDIKIGGKAIILKLSDKFAIFVLSASLKIDSKIIKNKFNIKSIRFANKEELLFLTSLVPGSIPPFGDIFNLDLYIDESIINNEKIAFNAGSLTDSVIMNVKDYLKISNHKEIFLFSAR